MKKFSETEEKVKKLLEDIPDTRKSDEDLFDKYWQSIAPQVDFRTFFLNPKRYGGTKYKCVERVRRRVQAKHPELKDAKTAEARLEESMNYEEYAING